MRLQIALILGFLILLGTFVVSGASLSEDKFIEQQQSELDISNNLERGEQIDVSEVDIELNITDIREEYNESGLIKELETSDDGLQLNMYYLGSSSPEIGMVEKSTVDSDTLYVYITRKSPYMHNMDFRTRGKSYEFDTDVEKMKIETVTYRDKFKSSGTEIRDILSLNRWEKTDSKSVTLGNNTN